MTTYLDTFYPTPEGVEKLAVRLTALASIIDLDVDSVPMLCDGWVEKHVSEDDPNRGHLLVVIYTAARTNLLDNAASIFAMRAHPRYAYEVDGIVAPQYVAFYFRVPADEVSEMTLASLVAAAVDPVDTDERWRAALQRGTSR